MIRSRSCGASKFEALPVLKLSDKFEVIDYFINSFFRIVFDTTPPCGESKFEALPVLKLSDKFEE